MTTAPFLLVCALILSYLIGSYVDRRRAKNKSEQEPVEEPVRNLSPFQANLARIGYKDGVKLLVKHPIDPRREFSMEPEASVWPMGKFDKRKESETAYLFSFPRRLKKIDDTTSVVCDHNPVDVSEVIITSVPFCGLISLLVNNKPCMMLHFEMLKAFVPAQV